jgi:hypothetical protein
MDKGQCIIGYQIKEVSIFEKIFVNADQLIIQLTNLKILFAIETNNYEENFMEVKLEHMEDESEIISFPVPYVIEYSS